MPRSVGMTSRGVSEGAPVCRTRSMPVRVFSVLPQPAIWKPAMYSWPSAGLTEPLRGGVAKSLAMLTTLACGREPR